ncbi:MAG: beta-lactamase family protein, partial [Gammaproteobacteria bacterium]|nr:beta-lactamase family protein [Gammaproteobacteria bacterium]
YDWEKITSLLAAQAPWWEPGTATAYHALTQGYLIGELVRRISGKSIGRFFQEELASPLGADFFIGVPASEAGRIARLIPPAKNFAIKTGENKESIAARTFRSPAITAQDSWTPEWQQAEIPAANGHGNARSVVKVHSLLACKGQINGLRLLSRESAESVMHERIAGTDMALGAPMRFGLGFGINSPAMPLSPNANACFWGGWGGSAVIIDQDAGIAMSYVMNKMYPGLMGDTRSADFVGAVYQALAG